MSASVSRRIGRAGLIIEGRPRGVMGHGKRSSRALILEREIASGFVKRSNHVTVAAHDAVAAATHAANISNRRHAGRT